MDNSYVPDKMDFTTNEVVKITDKNINGSIMLNNVPCNLAVGLPRYRNRGCYNEIQLWVETEPGHWSEFDGHEIEIDVEIKQYNKREINEWKGIDSVRKSGEATIKFDGTLVYKTYTRDISDSLIGISYKIKKLQALQPLYNHIKGRHEHGLIDRKVYYRGEPGTITHFCYERGVFIKPDEGKFKNPRPKDQDATYEWWEDYEDGLYVDLLSEHIYWYRD